jgi:hypothetical protein
MDRAQARKLGVAPARMRFASGAGTIAASPAVRRCHTNARLRRVRLLADDDEIDARQLAKASIIRRCLCLTRLPTARRVVGSG